MKMMIYSLQIQMFKMLVSGPSEFSFNFSRGSSGHGEMDEQSPAWKGKSIRSSYRWASTLLIDCVDVRVIDYDDDDDDDDHDE